MATKSFAVYRRAPRSIARSRRWATSRAPAADASRRIKSTAERDAKPLFQRFGGESPEVFGLFGHFYFRD
jgi:hypothetical protein